MSPDEFLPYLKLMQQGYTYKKKGSPTHTWYLSRTDDILAIQSSEKLTLTCLGTQPKWREWFWNIAFRSVEWLNIGRVHGGFAKNVHELLGREDEPDSLIKECLSDMDRKVVVVGHSRGYPIAVLVATQLLSHGFDSANLMVVGCGGARVGNKAFKRNYERMLGDRTNVLNAVNDPVPRLPPWGNTNGEVTKITLGSRLKPKHSISHYINAVSQK